MQRTGFMSMLVVTAVVGAVGVHAQSENKDDNAKNDITVTGCLQPAGGAVGTSGSSASTARPGTPVEGPLMLVNARIGAVPGGGSAVTSPAPPGSGVSESAVRAGAVAPSPGLVGATDKNGQYDESLRGRYLLRSEMPELARRVGQQVEISGRLLTPAANAGSGAASNPRVSSQAGGSAPATTGASGTSGAATTAGTPELEVRTVRMIASSCVVP